MLDKRMSPAEIVGRLRDGMTIGIGGWGTRRKPMALVREILRSPLKDLTVVSYGGPDVGLLCAAGKVRRLVFGFVSLDVIPLDPHFRAARQAGAIECTEYRRGHAAVGPARRGDAAAVPADRARPRHRRRAREPGACARCARPTTTARSCSPCRPSARRRLAARRPSRPARQLRDPEPRPVLRRALLRVPRDAPLPELRAPAFRRRRSAVASARATTRSSAASSPASRTLPYGAHPTASVPGLRHRRSTSEGVLARRPARPGRLTARRYVDFPTTRPMSPPSAGRAHRRDRAAGVLSRRDEHDDYTLAELCIAAAAEAWRDDGEVLASGIGLVPRLGAVARQADLQPGAPDDRRRVHARRRARSSRPGGLARSRSSRAGCRSRASSTCCGADAGT